MPAILGENTARFFSR